MLVTAYKRLKYHNKNMEKVDNIGLPLESEVFLLRNEGRSHFITSELNDVHQLYIQKLIK